MPIAIALMTNAVDDEETQEVLERLRMRALIFMRIVKYSFYFVTLVWFIASIVTGLFTVRSACNLITIFNAMMLLWGVIRIRKLISHINKG